jgi:hypothetical protein
MEPKGSLPCSQEPFTSPHLEPDESVHTTTSYFSNIFIFSAHLYLDFYSGVSFLLAFQPKFSMHFFSPHTCYMSCPSLPCSLHLLIIFWEEYKLRSFSLYSLLQLSIISSLFG